MAHVTADFKANRLAIKENHPSSINYEDGDMAVDIEDIEVICIAQMCHHRG